MVGLKTERNVSVMLAMLGDPAELSDRKRGTVTTVLRVCHFMKIVSTSSTTCVISPLYAFAE